MPTLLPKLSMNAIRESYIDADLKGQFYRSKRPRGKPNEFALEKPRFGSGAEKRLKDRKKKKMLIVIIVMFTLQRLMKRGGEKLYEFS